MNSSFALLTFMISPVQPFIESARTLRDLWSGSYLLSWLTAHAMQPIIDEPGCGTESFVTPHLDVARNALLRAVRGEFGEAKATLPNLPNKFTAVVPSDKAQALQNACVERCRAEWLGIAEQVRGALQSELRKVFERPQAAAAWDPGWDRNWDQQISSFFEMRGVVQPIPPEVTDESDDWITEWNRLGNLLAMTRMVKHVPCYTAQPDDDHKFPNKCSLLGTFEQMGPGDLSRSADFWEQVTSPQWKGFQGTRLESSDRLCAVSLVKRFAWVTYFKDRLRLETRSLRYSDTATMAAMRWLSSGNKINPNDVRGSHKMWSGQWLHWPDRTQQDEEPCPEVVWKVIRDKRKEQGPPPTYYALIHLDGDKMGDFFQGQRGPDEWGKGKDRYREITRRLTDFAQEKVEEIVRKHDGELIYAGGDDILAFSPLVSAIDCAKELRDTFCSSEGLASTASLSGGVAVVHYKEDLRFALNSARQAEKAAKSIGRHPHHAGKDPEKNALALAICRRSGEHSLVVMGWSQTEGLSKLVRSFIGPEIPREAKPHGVSDRWTYLLRAELPTLGRLPAEVLRSEVLRLMGRIDGPPPDFVKTVIELFDSYALEMSETPADPELGRRWSSERILDGFVKLCQAAAFLARGRDK